RSPPESGAEARGRQVPERAEPPNGRVAVAPVAGRLPRLGLHLEPVEGEQHAEHEAGDAVAIALRDEEAKPERRRRRPEHRERAWRRGASVKARQRLLVGVLLPLPP